MKNKKPQLHTQLSPQNYIKTKARTLPIYKCYINEAWEESGLANIIVVRKHMNEKFTFAGFLVDIFALGTKNTFFNFNQPEDVLDDLLSKGNFVEIKYDLVHNIIYGANEFAEDHNFKVHKDFKNITQYLLEVDDEKILFIDMEFGKNGKPLVIDVTQFLRKY